jgi:hypothetical protein
MKPRKSKSTTPSLRDRLSDNFMKAFEADFAAHGVDVIEQLRLTAPDRYAAIATQLIASVEPPAGIFDKAQSMQDIGRGLLQQVGLTDPSEAQIEMAIKANDELVAKLEMIVALGVSEEIEEYRELQS